MNISISQCQIITILNQGPLPLIKFENICEPLLNPIYPDNVSIAQLFSKLVL
jgi:hypothetical protein